VAHAPFVFLRAAPSTKAEVLSLAAAGQLLDVDAERDGWLRTAAPVRDGRRGWALVDGAQLGLGRLLEPAAF